MDRGSPAPNEYPLDNNIDQASGNHVGLFLFSRSVELCSKYVNAQISHTILAIGREVLG